MDWSQEQVATLKKLKAEGKSATQIGKVLGCSRNAVIGKLHRISKDTIVPINRKPYLCELSYSSWSSPRYREE